MSARLHQHLIRFRNSAGLLLTIAVLSAACGNASSSGDDLPPNDSSSSQLAVQVPGGGIGVFDGDWVLAETTVSGQTEVEGLPLVDLAIQLEVDDTTSTLVVHTNCHQRSGSYTFDPDHAASISLPGSTTQTCDTIAAAFEDLAVRLLESVTGWERSDDQLTLFADPRADDETSAGSSPGENPFPATMVFRLAG